MMLQTLTHSEEEVMQLIWNKGKIYFRELMEIFPEPKPHQNTVSTFLKILVDKHYLTTEKQGRIYLYSPAISFEDYKKTVLKNFLENYFENSATSLLQILIDENFIKAKDLNQFFKIKTTVSPLQKNIITDNPIKDFVNELTRNKKKKKKDRDKKKKKKK